MTQKECPDLIPHLRTDLDAFWYLNRLRPAYFSSLGSIPEREIEAYARLRGWEFGSTELIELISNVRVLDDEYLKIFEENKGKREQEEDLEKKRGKRGSNRH